MLQSFADFGNVYQIKTKTLYVLTNVGETGSVIEEKNTPCTCFTIKNIQPFLPLQPVVNSNRAQIRKADSPAILYGYGCSTQIRWYHF
jgi:hypothetical protein